MKENYMDYIPTCNPLYTWDADEKGIVTVHVVNKGFYNLLAQKFFKRPRISHIKLDIYGSYVWQQMDSKRTVFEISKLVGERFGEDAEPLIPRLVKYFQILYDNKFIGYVKPLKKKKTK
ncbi:MAG: PqqD family protein [Lachnospiraceae bacterium]|nr:PqqD family protein [Lachnospiraceae bacterium]